MSRLCIEDSLEYHLRRVVKQFVSDFDSKSEALKAIKEGDHVDQFLTYLWDDVNSYMDIEQLIEETEI